MIIYPAIDLKDGACVRLLRGDMTAVTVYNEDPAEQARGFAEAGFTWIHLVDLNGAVEGRPVNAKAVESIIAATKLPVQLGGGIRNIGTIEDWLSRGVERVVLGTAAVRNPSLVKEASKKFPGRVAVSIDSREGLVAVEGWRETSTMRTLDLALDMEQAGVAAIVFTDINRDGAMGGINLEATVDLAFALTTPVIASGGVSSLEDIVAVKREEKSGIAGVICGRALYDGRVDPAAALAVMNGT
ncbi:MAG TPA: 1-(5-phosphoribosyl)-5-[(5-phosphoribosylamino)methylideneamino]imidazole-4-carboxamide isomerase [Alphaproteobacteria bacterium]|jgi:phosphoribosylformimino-5-aminoimidazole carboxamide ribotide isomerase|nr:1-(5-phosphoribosyl)-5-[(5-phosphoribosylamino)methylideneamino]imidazole-4-carboxamide isomerase [Alphaproteobacteria bacterium]